MPSTFQFTCSVVCAAVPKVEYFIPQIYKTMPGMVQLAGEYYLYVVAKMGGTHCRAPVVRQNSAAKSLISGYRLLLLQQKQG